MDDLNDSPQHAVDDLLVNFFNTRFLYEAQTVRDEVSLNKLAELIADGEEKKAIALTLVKTKDLANRVANNIASAAFAAGDAEAVDISDWDIPEVVKKAQLSVVFNRADPNLVKTMNQQRLSLITQMTSHQLNSVKASLNEGVAAARTYQGVSGHFALNPREVARDFRDGIGLTSRQSQAVRNFRRNAALNPSQALKYKLRDKRHDSVLQAYADGVKQPTKAQIDKMADRYRERYIKHRAETIARTEMIRAANTARHSAWAQATKNGTVKEENVRRFWSNGGDNRVRDTHRDIPKRNKEGVKINQPFKSKSGAKLMFPGDPTAPPAETINCRCAVVTRIVGGKKKKQSAAKRKRKALTAAADSLPASTPRKAAVITRNTERLRRLDRKTPLPSPNRTNEAVVSSYSGEVATINNRNLPARLMIESADAASDLSARELAVIERRMLVKETPLDAKIKDTAKIFTDKKKNVAKGDFTGADSVEAFNRAKKVERGIGRRRWEGLAKDEKIAEINAGLNGNRIDIVRESVAQGKDLLSPLQNKKIVARVSGVMDNLDDANAAIRNGIGNDGLRASIRTADNALNNNTLTKDLVLYGDEADFFVRDGIAVPRGFKTVSPVSDTKAGQTIYRISSTGNGNMNGAVTANGENILMARNNTFKVAREVVDDDGRKLIDLIPDERKISAPKVNSAPKVIDPVRISDMNEFVGGNVRAPRVLPAADDAMAKFYNSLPDKAKPYVADKRLADNIAKLARRYDTTAEIPLPTHRKIVEEYVELTSQMPKVKGKKKFYKAMLVNRVDDSSLFARGARVRLGHLIDVDDDARKILKRAADLSHESTPTNRVVMTIDDGKDFRVMNADGDVTRNLKTGAYDSNVAEVALDTVFWYTDGVSMEQTLVNELSQQFLEEFAEDYFNEYAAAQDFSQALRYVQVSDVH